MGTTVEVTVPLEETVDGTVGEAADGTADETADGTAGKAADGTAAPATRHWVKAADDER